jgi:hypothetical protein
MLEKRAPDISTPPHHHGRSGEKPPLTRRSTSPLHLATTAGQEKEGKAAPLQHGEDTSLIEEAAASSDASCSDQMSITAGKKP